MYLVRHTPVWQYLALATLCVPVIIQPLVEQAFHNLLPYRDMALFYSSSDLASLPDLLRAVPPNRVCELRRAAALLPCGGVGGARRLSVRRAAAKSLPPGGRTS